MTEPQATPRPGTARSGAMLLLMLDAALTSDAGDAAPDRMVREPGFAAAIGLNQLIANHRLTWDDVLSHRGRLAKLCGRLGSSFEPERAVAYKHAVRFILDRRTTWSSLVRLPVALQRAIAFVESPPADILEIDNPEIGVSPPEGDWSSTIEHLKTRLAWRCAAEELLLNRLAQTLSDGQAISAEDARLVRDIWWCAELHGAPVEGALE